MSETVVRPIIGMEIHVQLRTRTKIFCGCPLEFAAPPNSRVCPVCGGLPGSLPVINRTALEYSVRTGLALGCRIAPLTKWDRKSYYYPDLPKNYQISQYDLPVAENGMFEFPLEIDGRQVTKQVRIRRAHLEEDAGKNTHEGLDHTRVDLNRAGTPLLEIVTEPDVTSPQEAYTFCTELHRLVRHLGVSDADMQKGQMRFEPNINLAITHDGREYRTPISEVKNLNSFRAVHDAIAYEIRRQRDEWESDHDYTLDSRGKMNFGWNDHRGTTEFQRSKEEAHDYRYFPEPDLVPITFSDAHISAIGESVCELPTARQARYQRDFALNTKDADAICSDRATAELFDAILAAGGDKDVTPKHFLSFWTGEANKRNVALGALGISAEHMAELSNLVAEGSINATTAATVAGLMLERGDAPRKIVEAEGMLQVRDVGQMEQWVNEAFAANEKAVNDARGNPKKAQAAAGFLRGQVMKLSQGKADPRIVGELITKRLADGA